MILIGAKGEEGFKITNNTGFHVTFENGVTVSVQFGPANYCENKKLDILENYDIKLSCENAEVAIFIKNGKWITKEYKDAGDEILGWVGVEEVLKILNWAKNYETTLF